MKHVAYAELDELELAVLAARDRGAAEEVLLRVQPRVKRAIRMMVGNDRDYDDMHSQVCLQVLESVGRFKGTGTLEAWAGRIAFHVVAKHAKRRRMVDRVMLPDFKQSGIETTDPEKEATRNYVRERMRETLKEIPEIRRNTLVLRLVLGHSISEIADMTSVPVNTVRGRLRTGLKELRRAMVTEREFMLAQ